MTAQLGLFDIQGVTIQQRFWNYHQRHPEVIEELERLTRQAVNAGRTRLGIRMLWERMRWTFYIERGNDDFKMNDHYHSRYVRLMIQRHPEWANLFELRELRA